MNAAPPYQVGQGWQPGSYISIFGSDLADATLVESTQSLPVSLAMVSVSFDGGGKSLPGHYPLRQPADRSTYKFPGSFRDNRRSR